MARFIETPLAGLLIVEPEIFRDDRGVFLESYRREWEIGAWPEGGMAQCNRSSSRRNVLRGLHYQIRRPQAKLISVAAGAVWDVAVDLRRSSPTFGRWYGTELSADNFRQIFIPAGFAHGFYSLSGRAEVIYLCSDYYLPEFERGLAWNCPDIGIAWPLSGDVPILSGKDGNNPGIAAIPPEDLPD